MGRPRRERVDAQFHSFWFEVGGLGKFCECSTGSQHRIEPTGKTRGPTKTPRGPRPEIDTRNPVANPVANKLFPCRCRGVGRPRRERVDAHFRHRFLCCPCRCRGLGRPRRERVDAQFHCFWLELGGFAAPAGVGAWVAPGGRGWTPNFTAFGLRSVVSANFVNVALAVSTESNQQAKQEARRRLQEAQDPRSTHEIL